MTETNQEPEPLRRVFDPRLISRIGRAQLSVENLHDWIVATLQDEVDFSDCFMDLSTKDHVEQLDGYQKQLDEIDARTGCRAYFRSAASL